VITTTASREEAVGIATMLLEQQLVACCQISAIESLYVWGGDIRQEPEFRLLLKTRVRCYPAVEALIRSQHSYALPAIAAVAIDRAEGAFAAWLEQQCGAD
jgi:periplasmic divalent cation tolerance protein